MITLEYTSEKEFDNGAVFNPNYIIWDEFDEDFYSAKDKTDLNIIREKVILELYKI